MTVVQKQDVAARQVFREPAEHTVSVAGAGIEAAPGPAGKLQPCSFEHRGEKGIAQPRGCAEEARGLAGGIADRLLRARDFRRHGGRTQERKALQVALRMVFHRVSAAHDLARQGRVLQNALTDAEERRVRAVRIEQVEDVRGDLGIRTIVNGDGDGVARRAGTGQARPV